AAMRAGFGGGMVVDFPHSTRAKKYFLCLFAGEPNYKVPKAKEEGEEEEERTTVRNISEVRERRRKLGKRAPINSKEWILGKKERQRKQGKEVARDSKYSGRKRRIKFA
ncbi:18S rRNA (guanine-N(7))-methyltransferase, partial [Acrasis kona]